jgi:hemolysin
VIRKAIGLIATLLLVTDVSASSAERGGRFLTRGEQALPFAAHDQFGIAALRDLPGAFSGGAKEAGRRLVSGGLFAGFSQRSEGAWAGSDPLVTWVTDAGLGEASVRGRVLDMFLRGGAVLVLRTSDSIEVNAALNAIFGAVSHATIAVYYRSDDSTLQTFTINARLDDGFDLSAVMERLGDELEAAMRKSSLSRASALLLANDVDLVALPRLNLSETAFPATPNGSSVTVTASVVRHSSRDRDVLNVVSKAAYNLIPHHRGLSGGALIVPGKYNMKQTLSLDGSGSPAYTPVLVEQFPTSDSRTEITIQERKQTTTSYGFNISPEISAGLQGSIPEASAKLSYGFTFGKEYVDEKQLAFTSRDYFLGSAASSPMAYTSRSELNLELAPFIRSNPGYFGKPPEEQKVTATMRQSSPETYAVWELDGRYLGAINLNVQSVITNASFDGSRVEDIPDPRPQAVATLSFYANSPYLTRETSVFLQSQKGDGGCLRDANGTVSVQACPNTSHPSWVDDVHAQWQLDSEGRYFNRGSKRCMEMLPTGSAPNLGGEVIVRPCELKNSQRWVWRADRIYTLYDNASMGWRLYVDSSNVVRVRIEDHDKYQDLPTNPNHILLPPWSDYPLVPKPGAVVPSLGGFPREIPADWFRFGAVGSDQVWRVVTLRQGLHR